MRVIVTLYESLSQNQAAIVVEQEESDPSLVCFTYNPTNPDGIAGYFNLSPTVAKDLARALLIVAEEAQLLWK